MRSATLAHVAIKPLEQRVRDAFADDRAREFGDRYLELVVGAATETQKAARRTATLIALLIVVFLLIADAEEAEFTLGFVKLRDVSGALPLLPAVISFLYYDLSSQICGWFVYRELRGLVTKVLYPSLYENDLETALPPASIALWGGESWRALRDKEPGRQARMLDLSGGLIAAAIMLAAGLFMVFAFVHLFEDGDTNKGVVAASAFIAAVNFVRASALVDDAPDTRGL